MCGAEGLWLAVKLLTQQQLFLIQERQGLMGYIAPAPSSEALSEALQIVVMCTPPGMLAIKQGTPGAVSCTATGHGTIECKPLPRLVMPNCESPLITCTNIK
jgi:hypothetical protein